MTTTIRFPLLVSANGQQEERDRVLTLVNAQALLLRGGEATYTDLAPWKIDAARTESPYVCVVIEFVGSGAFTIGDGTVPIGLYGEIIDTGVTPNVSFKTLLGILGVNIAGTNVPVIPLDAQGGGDLVGFSQIVSNVANYDRLSVGGVGANIALAEGDTVTVRARPIQQRNWMG